MKQLLILNVILVLGLLQGCVESETDNETYPKSSISSLETRSTINQDSDSETVSSLAKFDREASIIAFSTTVHPLTSKHCKDCHSQNGATLRIAPYHAHTDYSIAHDAVVDTARVNFSDFSKSRLVLRLREDNHYCWSEDCNADADQMQEAIAQWASQIDTTEVAQTVGAKTQMNGIGSALISSPETINGTIVMQAESGTLSGRFITKQDSKASDFTYVGTELPPNHPIGGTTRTPRVNFDAEACDPPTETDLQNTLTGPYQVREQRRHVDQAGYQFYSQRVSIKIVRPHLRSEFRTAVLNGATMAELNRFFLSTGGPEDRNNFDSALTGNQYELGTVNVLPEFRSKSYYDNTLLGSDAASYRNFFAPRFGPLSSEYWTASDSDIRSNLDDTLKRGNIYDQVVDRYRRFFFDYNRTRREWVAQNRVRDVPVTLRKLLDTDGTPFEENNLSLSQQFYDYYIGGGGLNSNEEILTRENALDIVGGIPRIDSYVYYVIDPADRSFNNFTQNHRLSDGTLRQDRFILSRGTVNLDLSRFYTGNNLSDNRSIFVKNYADKVKPVLSMNNCAQCHGDGSNRPQFVQNNNDAAYDAAASITNFFNTSNPSQSRPVQRMLIERHNCGGAVNCDSIGNRLIEAITEWNDQNIADQNATQDPANSGFVSLSEQERTPGRARFEINIKEAGTYNVWLKLRTTAGDANSFFVRILDEEGNPIPGIGDGEGRNASENCKRYDVTTNGDWDWYTASINNIENRIVWNLGVGRYSLEVVEREVGAALDMIAISNNPEFNPAKNLIDESNIQSSNPKILVYDISDIIGEPGQFEIEIKENTLGGSYIFRNPRFTGASSNIRFSNIKVLVNDTFEFTDASFTKLNRVVDGTDSGILTRASLLSLFNLGSSSDLFSFVFEDLTTTNQPVELLDDDAPVPIYGRECLNLELFSNTVMPILNNFKMMLKEDYVDYTSGNFPGNNRRTISNPSVYNCTTCHTEDHPYFKMTTFAEGLSAGDPIPQDGLEDLCAQALSRVDFGNFDRSLLLRGLNGTFNHPKLHFIQKVNFTGTDDTRQFVTSTTDPSGYSSEFIGLRFEKWTADDLNIDSYAGEEKQFLERYVGRYRNIRYITYSNPFSLDDGIIMTVNDEIINEGTSSEDIQTADGRNLYAIINPLEELNSFNNLTSQQKTNRLREDVLSTNNPWKIKDGCIRQDFTDDDGILTDPCNNNVNVISEFESLKQLYRESIINWINEEKKSYDSNN